MWRNINYSERPVPCSYWRFPGSILGHHHSPFFSVTSSAVTEYFYVTLALDLYSGGSGFEYLPVHMLLWLKCFFAFHSLQFNSGIGRLFSCLANKHRADTIVRKSETRKLRNCVKSRSVCTVDIFFILNSGHSVWLGTASRIVFAFTSRNKTVVFGIPLVSFLFRCLILGY